MANSSGVIQRAVLREGCIKRYIIREVYRLLRYGPQVAEYAT
ncbi:hypothetical protein [Halomonas salinarum]|nr:hypothetical protein [Halomonas salinarum]